MTLLTGTSLQAAFLGRAHFDKAEISGANLDDAFLENAHLEISDVKQQQVYSAFEQGQGAHLPPWPDNWREQFEQPNS